MNRYRYQLEAFVDKLQGRTPQAWMTAEDSIANMKTIDAVYDAVSFGISAGVALLLIYHSFKSGLGVRPQSKYFGHED